MQITRFGQSALLIKETSRGARLLIDPGTFSSDAAFQLTGLDAILITHEHPDHCDPARIGALLAANPQAPVYAPAEVLDGLSQNGLSGAATLVPVTPGAQFNVGSLRVEPVGTTHQEILPHVPRCANSGFVITSPAGTRLFHPGDSYETVPSDIDILAVPLLGPWSSLAETVAFVTNVAPSRIFAMHDALLSDAGRALFWRFVTESNAGADSVDAELSDKE